MRKSQNQFRTKVSLNPTTNKISHLDEIMLLGSCFAQNIQSYFESRKFKSTYCPHGILFDPISIVRALNQYMETPKLLPKTFIQHSERFFHYHFHSAINDSSKDHLAAKIENILREGHIKLKESKYLIISLGTSIVFELNENEEIVANCHKMDGGLFTKKFLRLESIKKEWISCIENLQQLNPELKIILTVSPIRHAKNGFRENNLSKALLLQLTEILEKKYKHVSYFPSYEIMIDELRDYRFYSQDMLHPNETAIEYIASSFSSCHMNEESITLNEQLVKIAKSLAHKPFQAKSNEYKKHLLDVKKQIDKLCEAHPFLDYKKELKEIENRLAI